MLYKNVNNIYCYVQDAVKWDVLMSSVQGKMTPSTEMRFSDGTVKLTKTKLEPVKMQVATRSGNKKVHKETHSWLHTQVAVMLLWKITTFVFV